MQTADGTLALLLLTSSVSFLCTQPLLAQGSFNRCACMVDLNALPASTEGGGGGEEEEEEEGKTTAVLGVQAGQTV